jgi:hypothetical protein
VYRLATVRRLLNSGETVLPLHSHGLTDSIIRYLRRATGPATRPVDLRTEGRHAVLLTGPGRHPPVAVCGLCSVLVAVDDDGELRHAVLHDATDTIEAPWARS